MTKFVTFKTVQPSEVQSTAVYSLFTLFTLLAYLNYTPQLFTLFTLLDTSASLQARRPDSLTV